MMLSHTVLLFTVNGCKFKDIPPPILYPYCLDVLTGSPSLYSKLSIFFNIIFNLFLAVFSM